MDCACLLEILFVLGIKYKMQLYECMHSEDKITCTLLNQHNWSMQFCSALPSDIVNNCN